jgi:hypothetical protein
MLHNRTGKRTSVDPNDPQPDCQWISGKDADEAMSELLLKVVTPVAVEVTLAVQQELQARWDEVERLRKEQVERARYEAELAQRRYMRVDPSKLSHHSHGYRVGHYECLEHPGHTHDPSNEVHTCGTSKPTGEGLQNARRANQCQWRLTSKCNDPDRYGYHGYTHCSWLWRTARMHSSLSQTRNELHCGDWHAFHGVLTRWSSTTFFCNR